MSTSSKVFVGGLAWETNNDALRAAFEKFGAVEDCYVISDRETGRSRGFGFVTFAESKSAEDAVEGMKDQELDGRSIRVDMANDRPPRQEGGFRDRPPRDSGYGGGRGGDRRGDDRSGGSGGSGGRYGSSSRYDRDDRSSGRDGRDDRRDDRRRDDRGSSRGDRYERTERSERRDE